MGSKKSELDRGNVLTDSYKFKYPQTLPIYHEKWTEVDISV